MPLSWTPQTTASMSNVDQYTRRPVVAQKRERKFVPKEKQLEKLRKRLEQEQMTSTVAVDICRNCNDEVVFL